MANPTQTAKTPATTKQPIKPILASDVQGGVALAEMEVGILDLTGASSIQGQADRLGNARLQALQRQMLAGEIGQIQGNGHLQRVVAFAKREREDALYQPNIHSFESKLNGPISLVSPSLRQTAHNLHTFTERGPQEDSLVTQYKGEGHGMAPGSTRPSAIRRGQYKPLQRQVERRNLTPFIGNEEISEGQQAQGEPSQPVTTSELVNKGAEPNSTYDGSIANTGTQKNVNASGGANDSGDAEEITPQSTVTQKTEGETEQQTSAERKPTIEHSVEKGKKEPVDSQEETELDNEEETSVESATPQALSEADSNLIDLELAEHQRWGTALERVGGAESGKRAKYILDRTGAGALGGFGQGLLMGAFMGGFSHIAESGAARGIGKIATKVATRFGPRVAAQGLRFTPLPAVGAVIGGALSGYDLLFKRDWSHTGETIGRLGKGASDYEAIANSIAAISEIIDVATNVANVIAGVIGGISIAMWALTVATAGGAAPFAATLTKISLAIGLGTMVLDAINALVLQRLVTLFRALHTFTSQADPRDVIMQGQSIAQAAGATLSFVGGMSGGVGGAKLTGLAGKGMGKARRFLAGSEPSLLPNHDAPPMASGDGPKVTAEPTVESSFNADQAQKVSPTPMSEDGRQTAQLPEDGHIVWAAIEQLNEKHAMGPGIKPKERSKIDQSLARAKEKYNKSVEGAILDSVVEQQLIEKYRAESEQIKKRMQAANSLEEKFKLTYEAEKLHREFIQQQNLNRDQVKLQRAKRIYDKKLNDLSRKQQQIEQKALEQWHAQMETISRDSNNIDDKGFNDAAWDQMFSQPQGEPAIPSRYGLSAQPEPEIVLPLSEPPRISRPGERSAKRGLLGRHGHQPKGRKNKYESEHIMPRAQWALITQDPVTGKPTYDLDQYGYDYTMLLLTEESKIKTHEGATSDNKRTQALKEKLQRGESVDVIQDIFLPSIEETKRARDVAAARRQAREQATPESLPTTPLEMPISQPEALPAQSLVADLDQRHSQVPSTQMGQLNDELEYPSSSYPSSIHTLSTGPRVGSIVASAANQKEGVQDASGITQDDLIAFAIGGLPAVAASRVGQALTNTQAGYAQARQAPIIEHVNPAYPPPPSVRQELVDLQNELLRLQHEHVQTEAVASTMSGEIKQHEKNEEAISELHGKTQQAIDTNQMHQQAIAQRQSATQQQLQKETESGGVITEYANRAAGLTMLTQPLSAVAGFTYLANYLPDSPEILKRAKRWILKLNRDATKFLGALASTDNAMTQQSHALPQRQQQIAGNASQLEQTAQSADTSGQTFNNAMVSAEQLGTENAERIAQATETREQAVQANVQIEQQTQVREEEIQTLIIAWQTWAQKHREARLNALEATRQRLKEQGYMNIEVHEL